MDKLTLLLLINALCFLYYGAALLLSKRMKEEFERMGKPQFRVLVGICQILGAIGLIVGLWVPWIGFSAAIGISVLMLLGVGLRVSNRDTIFQTLPAAFFCVLNAYLAVLILKTLEKAGQ